MKTLLLNPPSFEGFDGGAGARWPATREIASFWYPVWLCYPAGMIPKSRVVDAGPHHISVDETLRIAADYDFIVVFTSTLGFRNDAELARRIKEARPATRIAFVGPHVSALPEESLIDAPAVDFVVRKEFEYAVTEFVSGKPLSEIVGVSYREGERILHNPERDLLLDLDQVPFVVPIYRRDLDINRYNIPFLHHPYISFYTSRGCPSQCTFCLWPQTFSGRPWRVRGSENVVRELRLLTNLFPTVKEIFFDDDTFTIRKSRVLDLCEHLRPLGLTWSCNSRANVDLETLRAMKRAGCRLLVVGFESADPQVLKNMKKGITVEQSRQFVRDCHRAGLVIHADFILGLPGETRETIESSLRFACEIDAPTMQVSVVHAFPGTEFYGYLKQNHFLNGDALSDRYGHQAVNFRYPDLSEQDLHHAIERFYKGYYFRPKVVARIVGKALSSTAERRRLFQEARDFLSWMRRRREGMPGPVFPAEGSK